tara:strand:+ start:123 stop:821 length:699 start_codon:yes stop_codon:yes gene_type:complete
MRSASLPEGFFLGQIPPNWNEYLRASSWKDAHNNRVKVRIPGKHSKGDEVCDKDLPWAIVEQSTSSGYLSGSSVALWGGEWVTGYFLDKDEQLPVITGVLGVNTIEEGKISESACSTQFKPVKRFNSGLVAQSYQMTGGEPPDKPAEIDKKTIKEATTKGLSDGLDNLTATEAQELARTELDPTKTGASNRVVFEAAKTARETARAAGASQEEVERLVNIASIRALRSQSND